MYYQVTQIAIDNRPRYVKYVKNKSNNENG